MKAKIDEHDTNSKIKYVRDLYRGISDFKKGYHLRTNIGKDEKCYLFEDCDSILAKWRNKFSQLFIAHGVSDVHSFIHSFSNPSEDRSSTSSKTVPPHSAI